MPGVGVAFFATHALGRGERAGAVAGDRVRPRSALHQRLVDEGDRPVGGEADHEVPVLDRRGLGVEAAEGAEAVAAHHQGLGRIRLPISSWARMSPSTGGDLRVGPVAQPQPLAGGLVEPAEGQQPAVAAEVAGVRGPAAAPSASRASSAATRRRCPGRRSRRRAPRRRRGCARRRRRGLRRGISRSRGSATAARGRERAVLRAVVDDEQLEVAPALRQHALDRRDDRGSRL